MPRNEPGDWLTVAVRIVLDWRFLIAVAIGLRILLNRWRSLPPKVHTCRGLLYSFFLIPLSPDANGIGECEDQLVIEPISEAACHRSILRGVIELGQERCGALARE
jgi:hypothetical protein